MIFFDNQSGRTRTSARKFSAAALVVCLMLGVMAGGTSRQSLQAQDDAGGKAGAGSKGVSNAEPPPTLKPTVPQPDSTPDQTPPGPDAATKAAAEDAINQTKGSEMSKLFPIGRPFSGVRIPNYTGDSLNTMVTAEKMRRVDEEHLDMEKLVIVSFGSGEEPDTRIMMDRATYDMTSAKLISRSPVQIVQPRFVMTGDKMTFDTNTQVGHMTSNPGNRVRMIIFGVDQAFSGGMLGETESD